MSTRQHTQFSVTWNQVAAFRLSRHHLSERAPTKALIAVVRDMAGAQAQLLSAAQIALWSRVRDLRIAQVEEALSERILVKASCMRRTLFLVPSEHLAIFVRGSARRAEKELRWARGQGVPDRVVDAAIDAALGALDRPLTRPEIAARVSRALGVRMRAIPGGGWGRRTKVAAVPVGELTYPVVDLLHLTQAKFERPLIRLLPYFDSFLLGHKEREHLVSMKHRPKVYRAQGWIAPVVLVDGRATAVWAHTRQGNRLSVKVSKFESISRRITAGIWEEARDLGRFLGAPNGDVQIG